MRIKGAIAIAKSSFLQASAYRAFFVFTIVSNLIFTGIIYFLWKAIYASDADGIINGMTFTQTFIYLSLAGTMTSILHSSLDWYMSFHMKSGSIAQFFTRPMDFQGLIYASCAGDILTNMTILLLPSCVLVYIISGGAIKLGWNILFFLIALFLAALLALTFDFIIGLISFYTESVWGISTLKDCVISLLAGGIIPIAFFPDSLRRVVECLPFQAMYNLPLQILINKDYAVSDYLNLLLLQLFWIAVLLIVSRVFYTVARRAVTVNGG